MEVCHKIYQNSDSGSCYVQISRLWNTIEPANSFSQFFISAARLLFPFVLQFLLKSGKGRSLVEEYDKYENTPLHVAAKKGYVRIVQVSSNSMSGRRRLVFILVILFYRARRRNTSASSMLLLFSLKKLAPITQA